MSRRNDIDFSVAYGTGATLSITVEDRNTPPSPVDVTGYSARLQILKYDGSRDGLVIATLTSPGDISIGGVDGLLMASLSAALTSSFAASFGDPPPREPARYRCFATPPSGSEVEIAHGRVALKPSGSVIVPISASVHVDDFTVTVSALATPGEPGPPGTPGPTVLVDNTRIGAIPAVESDRSHLIAARSGPLVSTFDTVVYDKVQLHAKSYLAYGSGSYRLAVLAARDDLLTRTGGKNGGCIQFPHEVITMDGQLDFEGWTALELRGIGGSGYSSKSQLIFTTAPAANITGTSTASVLIGTGSKTFPITAGLYLRTNDVITFTATAGATGSITMIVTSYAGSSVTGTVTSTTGSGTGTQWTYSANSKDFLISFRGTLGCSIEKLRINVPRGLTGNHKAIDAGHGLAGGNGYNFKLSQNCIFGTDYNDFHTAVNLGGATGADVRQNLIVWCGYGIAGSNAPFTLDNNTILDCQYYPLRIGAFEAIVSNTTTEPLSAGPNAGRARLAEIILGTTNLTLISNYCGDSTATTTEWIHDEGQGKGLNLIGNYFSGNVGSVALKTEGGYRTTAIGNTLDGGLALFRTTNTVMPQQFLGCLGNFYAGGSAGPFYNTASSDGTVYKSIFDPGFNFVNLITLDRSTLKTALYRGMNTKTASAGVNHHWAPTDLLTKITGALGPYTIADIHIGGITDSNTLEFEDATGQYSTLAHHHPSASDAAHQLDTGGSDVILPPYGRWSVSYATGYGWRVNALTPPVVPGVQRGSTTLVAGVSPSIAAVLTANSVIKAWCKTPGGTVTSTVEYLAVSRATGVPGSFVAKAFGSDRTTVNVLDTSVVEWEVAS
jgi:hypothetical protein